MYHDFTISLGPVYGPVSPKLVRLGVNVYKHCMENVADHSRATDIVIQLCGHIQNHVALIKSLQLSDTATIEDCIKCMYLTYGIDVTLQNMEGEFAMMILDQRAEFEDARLYIATDSHATPIYYLKIDDIFIISTKTNISPYQYAEEVFRAIRPKSEISEMTEMQSIERCPYDFMTRGQSTDAMLYLETHSYREFSLSRKVNSQWKLKVTEKQLYSITPILLE